MKLIEKGVLNQALWDVIFANMRLSDEREGDALAMLDTARVAEMSLKQLSEKYGPDVVEQCVDELMDRAEETMRDRITELADGDYYYEQYMDSSGLSNYLKMARRHCRRNHRSAHASCNTPR